MPEREHTSTDGQPLGPRGLRTRERILEVVAELIAQHGLRGLKLADVADAVGFSAPAFYQYFRDLDEAILALCDEVDEHVPPFAFPGDARAGNDSRAFVEAFFAYWDRYRPLLWARNVSFYKGDVRHGDDRLRAIRDRALKPLLDGLTTRIEVGQRAGRIDASLAPTSVAMTLVVVIDRVGMLSPRMIEPWGDTPDQLVDAVVHVFDCVLGVGASVRSDQ